VISPEYASKLGIEDVFHLRALMRTGKKRKRMEKRSMSFAATCLWRMTNLDALTGFRLVLLPILPEPPRIPPFHGLELSPSVLHFVQEHKICS
jgi:hypothetical protein